jgi:hypothetical protein
MSDPDAVQPNTTNEEDRHSLGQRRVNLVWEGTQALIAVGLSSAYIYAALNSVTSTTLDSSFFLVVGFYFGRTNHQRVGGVTVGR